MSRKASPIVLNGEEKEILESISNSRIAPYRKVQRAPLILLAAEGMTNTAIAQEVRLQRSMVVQWRQRFFGDQTNLKPHLAGTFSVSNDPDFTAKVVDVVGLYMHPPENAVVLCVDEKTQVQALDRTQPLLPMRPGQIERQLTTTSVTAPSNYTPP